MALFCTALLGPDVSRQGTCLIYRVDSAATFRVEGVSQNWLLAAPASLAPTPPAPPPGSDITDFLKTGAAGIRHHHHHSQNQDHSSGTLLEHKLHLHLNEKGKKEAQGPVAMNEITVHVRFPFVCFLQLLPEPPLSSRCTAKSRLRNI